MAYVKIKDIFLHNQLWVARQLKKDPKYFKNLALGQKPQYLFIGCSDSRVSTEVLMNAEPGDVFIHRNIGNVVPSNDLNSLSVISYAVNHIRVKHIVVCGHYNCGGVKAAMTVSDAGLLNPWLRHIRDVYRLHKAQLNAIECLDERYDKLVELNVIEQCINIIKTRDVQKALLEKRLNIHAWVFDVRTGNLIDLKLNVKKIMKEIMDIYNLFDEE
ncbi:MAG: carbonic anhydrase [Bacteroidia bacterium]|nr:carbonic anhydrase [Bacteroidia bacterium]MCZ2249781.1 carbonic anhydrase [Bacteroidia bacterium]